MAYNPSTGVHEHWSSRFGFLMAAIGSSVGLGNFWRFPYTAGENGGSIFVFAYLLCVVLVAFPILIAEYGIGRRGGLSAMGSTRAVARETGAAEQWGLLGWVGAAAGFMILSFYSVVAGWVLIYIFKSFTGQFVFAPEALAAAFSALGEAEAAAAETAGADEMLSAVIGADFGATISNAPMVILAHTAFVGLTAFIVARGVQHGIETVVKVLMPAFFAMLLGIVLFNVFAGDIGAALGYLMSPQTCVLFDVANPAEGLSYANACDAPAGAATTFSLSNLGEIFSAALGQAFFSIGVGAGLMITYGAYLDKSEKVTGSARIVAGSDTLVALIAGLAIFPIVFGFGLDPNGGPGLFFVTLPIAFAQLPAIVSILISGVFFTLAFFAAITSSISLLEVAVSRAEERFPGKRVFVAAGLGVACWLLGIGSALSLDFLDVLDQVTEKLLLPLGGLLVALFAGWAVKREIFRDELKLTSDGMFQFWRLMIRWVAPIGAGVILLVGAWVFFNNPPALLASALGVGS